MKIILLRLLLLTSLVIAGSPVDATTAITPQQKIALNKTNDWILKQAFLNKKSGLQVRGGGVVSSLLSDDITGDRHQRFILRLASGQTLLMAHNVDIAPRLVGLRQGNTVNFYGQYEWNEYGGLVHWTHRDPNGQHINGWLKYLGKIYQ